MKVVLFDGVCNLCNASVNWIIDHDPKDQFRFASLQSDWAKLRLGDKVLQPDYMDSVVFDNNGELLFRSEAAISILRNLGGVFSIAVVLLIVPAFIRDFFYRLVARNRYAWFGKRDNCRVPTPELKNKFLS